MSVQSTLIIFENENFLTAASKKEKKESFAFLPIRGLIHAFLQMNTTAAKEAEKKNAEAYKASWPQLRHRRHSPIFLLPTGEAKPRQRR